MTSGQSSGSDVRGPQTIARAFVDARLAGGHLAGFPGAVPPDLAAGYAIQHAAIALWPDRIVGWKIGRVPPDFEDRFGKTRLVGPIFAGGLRRARDGGVVNFPVFEGGFSAVEAEFIYELGEDAPAGKTDWSEAEALALVGKLYIGIETAGSPLPTINTLGPTVTVADFGNNAGLILGAEIGEWRDRPITSFTCETLIDGRVVGTGGAANIPGGPQESLRFLLRHGAKYGRPLKRGMLVSSGAATGIHEIASGQSASVDFGQDGTIACLAVTARAAKEVRGESAR